MFAMNFSMEKLIEFFGLLDFFLPAINATVFIMMFINQLALEYLIKRHARSLILEKKSILSFYSSNKSIVIDFSHPHFRTHIRTPSQSHPFCPHTNSLQSNFILYLMMFKSELALEYLINRHFSSLIFEKKIILACCLCNFKNLPFLDRIKSNCSKLSKVATNISKN